MRICLLGRWEGVMADELAFLETVPDPFTITLVPIVSPR